MRIGLIVVLLAGCAAIDPLARPGAWQPTGANDANLRAMIADPDDLQHGRADIRADGQVVAAAITRYRTGHVKELPASDIAKVSPVQVNTGTPSTPSGDGS